MVADIFNFFLDLFSSNLHGQANRQTDRRRCIRAHHAWAQVGSKSKWLDIEAVPTESTNGVQFRFRLPTNIWCFIFARIWDLLMANFNWYENLKKKMQLDIGNEPYIVIARVPCLFISILSITSKCNSDSGSQLLAITLSKIWIIVQSEFWSSPDEPTDRLTESNAYEPTVHRWAQKLIQLSFGET